MNRWLHLIILIAILATAGCMGLDHPQPPKLPAGRNHRPAETIDLETGNPQDLPPLK